MFPDQPNPDLTPDVLASLPSSNTLARRRDAIQSALAPGQVALIFAGSPQARNFPANHYPDYRADSHFLYLVGQHLPTAVLTLTSERATLYCVSPSKSGALWHGPEKSFTDLSAEVGCPVEALTLLKSALEGVDSPLCLPFYQAQTQNQARSLIGEVALKPSAHLIEALVGARLIHDDEAIRELRYAARLTALSHRAGLSATLDATWAYELRAAMEAPLTARGARLAYAPIITPQGEVLHNHNYHARLSEGDLILADVGAETPGGWAGDVTRTWPKSGHWSTTQRALYEVVLSALQASTAIARPGVEYAALHQATRVALAQGLRDLGILKGSVEDALDANSVALFFPHGVGHLLGLDVHDMEDLGDAAGYAPGRARRDTFGWGYLRLDRPLVSGMAITIEPGFYQVPALLNDPAWAGPHAGEFVDWKTLERFGDARGIRIEDDLLITSGGAEVLSESILKDPDLISAYILEDSDER